jgi:hypothetical protein
MCKSKIKSMSPPQTFGYSTLCNFSVIFVFKINSFNIIPNHKVTSQYYHCREIKNQHLHFYYFRMATCNICCILLWSEQLPAHGHNLWPKHVAALNNKWCATNRKWNFLYTCKVFIKLHVLMTVIKNCNCLFCLPEDVSMTNGNTLES